MLKAVSVQQYSKRAIIAWYRGGGQQQQQHAVIIRRQQLLMMSQMSTTNNNINNTADMNNYKSFDITKVEEEVDDDSSSKYRHPRNKGIAEVIRAGWSSLNQTALDIQNNTSRKPLFTTTNNMSGSDGTIMMVAEQEDPRIKSEEHRILSVAKDCLHQIAQNKQDQEELAVFSIPCGTRTRNSSANGQGHHVDNDDTMIVLLNVEIKKGSREAILYWCLPYDILLNDNISSRQKQFLEFRIQQQLEFKGNKLLQRRVHTMLRHYFPPKLRFEPATNDQLYSVLQEISDW